MAHDAVIQQVDDALAAFIATSDVPETLRDAVRYALLGGGKRLRPTLAWRSAEAVGGVGKDSLPGGMAVELVHAFSLVHDDLPALDDDDLRRGRPTLHRHAGEAMAILAGDAMLNLAYEAIWRTENGLDGAVRVALVRELGRGTRAMIAGQIHDTLGVDAEPGRLGPRQQLELIHRNKTGALIRAACRMGAILGGAGTGSAELDAITRFADDLGLIFQIVDDLLDATGAPDTVGKATGKDAQAGKLTYPLVLGLEGSRREVERLQADAEAALAPLGPSARPLLELSRAMARRDR